LEFREVIEEGISPQVFDDQLRDLPYGSNHVGFSAQKYKKIWVFVICRDEGFKSFSLIVKVLRFLV